MKRWLKVRHETRYLYDAPVELAHHVACLCPRETPRQQVRGWTLTIDPPTEESLGVADDLAENLAEDLADGPPLPGHLNEDAWGNQRLHFSHSQVHDTLRVVSEFEAGLEPAPEIDVGASPPWEEVAAFLRYHAGAVHSEAVEFSLPSYYAPRAPALAALAREVFKPGRPVLHAAQALMELVYERFEYQPFSTSVHTLATDALALRRGVCQDFAHVMIGACRSIGLAARYVSGYLLTHPPAGQPRLLGADASHAWMEVWSPGEGWLALDPTNNITAGQDHVTLAWGRDYADVAPLRGVIRGGGRSMPSVAVTVMPLSEWQIRNIRECATAQSCRIAPSATNVPRNPPP